MLAPPDAIGGGHSHMLHQLDKFLTYTVYERKRTISDAINNDIIGAVHAVLHEIEAMEPRFIPSLQFKNAPNRHDESSNFPGGPYYSGLEVLSPTEFQVLLHLNQMGIFTLLDTEAVAPGNAILKLSDGRKRSMSLWVEFITASGYLSARKIRTRFNALIKQACLNLNTSEIIVLDGEENGVEEARLQIHGKYVVNIIPAFRCGIWPRSAREAIAANVKAVGFDLVSKEGPVIRDQKNEWAKHCSSSAAGSTNFSTSYATPAGTSDFTHVFHAFPNNRHQQQPGLDSSVSASIQDAWTMSFSQAEEIMLRPGCRRQCLSILKTLRDRHLVTSTETDAKTVKHDTVITVRVLTAVLLNECEKHPKEQDWQPAALGQRLSGTLIQLMACLQSRQCPDYFVPALDLFQGETPEQLEHAARKCWKLTREILTNSACFQTL